MAYEELGLSNAEQAKIVRAAGAARIGEVVVGKTDLQGLFAELHTAFGDTVARITEHSGMTTEEAARYITDKLSKEK